MIRGKNALREKREKNKMSYRFAVSALMLLLFALTACGMGGGTAPAASVPVQVTATDFHITSSLTTFIPGKTYHFMVTNQGKSMHEFMIMPKSEGTMRGMSMDDMQKLAFASIEMIDPGKTQTLDFTFPATASGSHPELACYFPGHYEAGMKLDVAVKRMVGN
jgi:uncharacterized cupredoxin-like copper-binding protein